MTDPNTPMVNMSTEEDEIDLLELFYHYMAHLKMIIAAFLIGAVIAGCYTYFLVTPTYKASAKLYMVSSSTDSVVDLTDLNIGTSLSSDYEVLMKIRPIGEEVIEELKLDYTYEQLMERVVSISVINDTRIIQVSATTPDPKLSKDIANIIADKAVTYLPELMETPAPNIAERAIIPEKKASPSLRKNTMIGALAAMVVVLGFLTVTFLLDDTLKTAEDVERFFDIMPLTTIPEGDLKELNESAEHSSKKSSRFYFLRKKHRK